MNSNFKRIQFFVWGFLLLVIVVIVGAFIRSKFDNQQSTKPLLVYGEIADFSLTNQSNEIISLDKLRGQIWIADVIFTRCPLQCIRMTKRMRQLQEALPKDASVKLVSITADPQFDTPEVFKNYAQQYGADQSRWSFLTGAKSEINRLVVESLKLVIYEKKPEEREVPADLFLHSTKFVLVDQQGRVRGWFDGEKEETKGEIIRAVKTLLR
ncbi:MAG: SCO family protein [Verrucomicrobiota bacterium]